MPLKRCTINGKRGWKWGDAGKCYTGSRGKAKAIKQAQAIRASGYEENSNREEPDVIEVMLRNAKRRKSKPTPNPLKRDPSRTKTLRDRFQRELRKRFRILKRRIRELLVEEDALGLRGKTREQRAAFAFDSSEMVQHSYFSVCPRDDKERCLPSDGGEEEENARQGFLHQNHLIENAYQGGRWRFMMSKGVLDMFLNWLQGQFKELIAPGGEEGSFLDGYIEEGFRRGMERAFDDTRRSQRVLEEIKKSAEEFAKKDFYEGSKREFLRSSFGRRIAKSKVEILAERTLTDLKGITESSARKMQHILLDGLVEGQHPRKIARDMSKALDIDRKRAETIARTEIIRTHAEGQLQALEDMGVAEIGVMVEWATAGDGRVCPLCEELEGVVLKVKEAHNLLPRHPNCRCAYIPANVSEEDTKQQVVEKPKIESAIESSIEKEGKEPSETSWAGADVRIDETGRKPSK